MRHSASARGRTLARLATRHPRGALGGLAVAVVLALGVAALGGGGTAEAAPTLQYLHAAPVTVGSTTYRTTSSAGPVGTLSTLAATLGSAYATLTNGGISQFASPVVPPGEAWNLAGTWTFDVWLVTDNRADSQLRARIYRVASGGAATLLYTTNPSAGFIRVETTYVRFTWTDAVPTGTTLAAGERFAVEFQVHTDGDGGTGTLGYDTTARNSSVTAQVAASSTPGAPTGVTATPGNAQASVSWTAPASDGGSPITGYTVTSSPDGLTATTPDGTTTTAVVTGLTNGTAYTFTVTATNANGTGPPSAASAAVTPATVPDAPTAVVATAGNGDAAVQWTPPASNGGSAITSYTVTSNPGGLTATTPNGSTTSAVVTGLTNGTAYTFTVTATNGVGTGPASTPSNSVTPTAATSAPGAPTNVSATGGNASATVLWSPPASNGGSPITFYTVTSSPGGITANSPDGSSTSLIISGLTNSTAYTFTVTATNAIGTGPASAPTNSVTPGAGSPPGPPQAVIASPGNTIATVQWNAPASDGGSPILSYTVTSSPGGITATTANGTTTNIVVTGLTNGVPYTFTVTATNALGTSTASPPSNAVVPGDYPGVVRSAHFRIGRDLPLTAMDWYASTDTSVTSLTWGEIFRVRMQVYNNGNSAKTWTPRLDVSTLPDSAYAAVPTVSGAQPFYVYNTTQFANGAAIDVTNFGLGSGIGTAQNGIAYDAANPAGAPIGLNALSYTEVEFSVFATNNAVQGQTYYFRITDGGTPFSSYDTGAAAVAVGYPMPPPPASQPPAHNFHQPYSADTSACAACHREHTSPAPAVLYKQWPEEAVCYTCHDGSAAPNIKSQFEKTYRMPITATAGVHSKDEARNRDPLSFSGTNRHVECADCHNPHLAGRGNHTVGSNYAFAPQQGVWGIAVTNTAPWTPPTFTTTYPIQFQYQLCFKCHSSWAYGTNPPMSPSGGFPQTDQSKEFNPLNPAYHPVEDVGKNPFVKANGTSYASSLIGGFTPTGRMVCSDCHMSETSGDPAGPHGSTQPFLLRGQWDRTTGRTGTSNHLCFNCHAWSTYGPGSSTAATGFYAENRGNLHGIMVGARNKANNDQPIVCQDCHVAIVHGYQRDHLLGFTGDGQPYVNRPYTGGLVQIDTWRASGQWTFDSCGTAMNSCK